MAHWYDADGNLHEFYLNKKGEQKEVTLRQARKEEWVPSVTTIIKDTMVNFGLKRYWEDQILTAAATTPRPPTMTDDEWKKQVMLDADEHSRVARERGTELHDQIRRWLRTGESPDPILEPVVKWLWDNLDLSRMISEKAWVDPWHWFAGTIDCLAPAADGNGWVVVDFKSQERGSLAFWEDFPIQLAGYAAALIDEDGTPGQGDVSFEPLRRVSMVFHRNEKAMVTKEWDAEETARCDRIFARMVANWRDLKKYWPGKQDPDLLDDEGEGEDLKHEPNAGPEHVVTLSEEAELSWYREANELFGSDEGSDGNGDPDKILIAEEIAKKLCIRGCPPRFMERWVDDVRINAIPLGSPKPDDDDPFARTFTRRRSGTAPRRC